MQPNCARRYIHRLGCWKRFRSKFGDDDDAVMIQGSDKLYFDSARSEVQWIFRLSRFDKRWCIISTDEA